MRDSSPRLQKEKSNSGRRHRPISPVSLDFPSLTQRLCAGRLPDRASARCWCRPCDSPPAAIPAPSWARAPSWPRAPSHAHAPSWARAPHRARAPRWPRRAPGISAAPSRTPHAARTHGNEPSRTRTPHAAAAQVRDPAHLSDIRSLADDLFRFWGHPVWHRRSRSRGEGNTTKRGEGNNSHLQSHGLSPPLRLQNARLVQWLLKARQKQGFV